MDSLLARIEIGLALLAIVMVMGMLAQKAKPESFPCCTCLDCYSTSQVDSHTQVLSETWSCINQLASREYEA